MHVDVITGVQLAQSISTVLVAFCTKYRDWYFKMVTVKALYFAVFP